MIHEDERRTLEPFPEAKIITIKQDCVIGNHYHKIKTEKFILLKGKCKLNLSTVEGIIMRTSVKMKTGETYTVPPNTWHEFQITKDSILLGFNSHPYDSTDDYKL
ncbi:MAG TPA: cupin domain-containing protein [Cyclobacteriaceae bacterium]|nr:cupin domain-containing protein [Cyclobacteriaceae bacterium]